MSEIAVEDGAAELRMGDARVERARVNIASVCERVSPGSVRSPSYHRGSAYEVEEHLSKDG